MSVSIQQNHDQAPIHLRGLLRHFADLSYEQVAAALDLPEKTVKSRLFTARQVMRDLLEREGLL